VFKNLKVCCKGKKFGGGFTRRLTLKLEKRVLWDPIFGGFFRQALEKRCVNKGGE